MVIFEMNFHGNEINSSYADASSFNFDGIGVCKILILKNSLQNGLVAPALYLQKLLRERSPFLPRPHINPMQFRNPKLYNI